MPILTEQERCGTVLAGKYEIESILGRGGMGVVFRARHLHTDRPVAIKILRPDLSHDLTLSKRFVREAKAASLLRHPNVVEVLDLGIEDDGTVYQVLELLDGEPLSRLLEFKGSLGVGATLGLLLPLMDALVAAHARGIVHRDLKPDNIFLARTHDGRLTPTLLDFGIAKMMDGKQSLATRTGSVMGTPQYMAPEQARGGKEHGPGIDVWAMGVIAFECLTGVVPFEAESPTLVLLKILTERAPRLDALDPAIPAPIADAIDAALTPDTQARHASMSAFVDALRAAAEAAEVELPPPQVSTTGPLTLPPPSRETDPDGVTELPADEVVSLALDAPRGDAVTAGASPRAKAGPRSAATLLGPGPEPAPDAPERAPAAQEPPAEVTGPLVAPLAEGRATTPRPERRARPMLWGVGALAAVSFVGVIAWAWASGTGEVAPPPAAAGEPERTELRHVGDALASDVEHQAAPVPTAPAEPAEIAQVADEPEPAIDPTPSPRGAARGRTPREPRAAEDEAPTPPRRPAVQVEVGERGEGRRLPGVVEW